MLSLGDFEPHLHTRFHVKIEGNYELELAEINDHSNEQVEQFSLIFKGAASPWLRQGSYKLTHSQLREWEVFLVPLGPENGQMHYQAVFSRLIRKP